MTSPIMQRALFVIASLVVASCAWLSAPEPPAAAPCPAPAACTATAPAFTIVARDDPPWPAAAVASAVLPAGQGGISMAFAVRLQQDTRVYRVWTDEKKHRTERIGPWWTFDPPSGTAQDYRERYAVCEKWNAKLSRLAACTLARGTVVVLGPGQSVNATTCEKAGEAYDANPYHHQVYIPKEELRRALTCPPADHDARLDHKDLGAATRPCTLADRCATSLPRAAACC